MKAFKLSSKKNFIFLSIFIIVFLFFFVFNYEMKEKSKKSSSYLSNSSKDMNELITKLYKQRDELIKIRDKVNKFVKYKKNERLIIEARDNRHKEILEILTDSVL